MQEMLENDIYEKNISYRYINLTTFRTGWINNRLKKIARQSHDDRTKDDEELDLTLECCTYTVVK